MRHIEPPDTFDGAGRTLFLAGGISGCSDWQHELEILLEALDVVALNPRRRHFNVADPTATTAQIEWEFRHLQECDAIAFWFPSETLCPIALFELGAWSARPDKPIFVGAHPDYARRVDIVDQLRLARTDVLVVATLEALAQQVRTHFALQ